MRLAWLTDIHLNFVDGDRRRLFLESASEQADAVAVSGDVGESHNIGQFLREIDELIQKPVYFVLGNHDFYKGSIAQTRVEVAEIAQCSKHLKYLTVMGVNELTPQTAILGHDGWADGQFGNYWNSPVLLNDHVLIAELSKWYRGHSERQFGPQEDRMAESSKWQGGPSLDKVNLLKTLERYANEAAHHFEKVLEEAASQYRHIVAVTHVPPFREAAWYRGKVSGDDFLPYFACKAVGDVMERVMRSNPQSRLLVLCGHTHDGGELQVLDNLRVLTGEARYGHPEIQQILEIE